MEHGLRIGEAARAAGLNPKTIRYYEEIGLTPPPRRREGGYASHGQRLFTQEDLRCRYIAKRTTIMTGTRMGTAIGREASIPASPAQSAVSGRSNGHSLASSNIAAGYAIAKEVRPQVLHHLPHISWVMVHVDPQTEVGEACHRVEAHAHDGLSVHSHS